jgi:hypothetical protein
MPEKRNPATVPVIDQQDLRHFMRRKTGVLPCCATTC